MYGWAPGTLKGNLESLGNQYGSMTNLLEIQRRAKGYSNDLLAYWKIYSRMGMGARLAGVDSAVAQQLEVFGDHAFLVVAPGHCCPLNLPLHIPMEDDEIQQRAQWPIPFWADRASPWPWTMLAFHHIPRKIWPMSHLKPAMGELMFLNWAYSYLATKIAVTSRDILAIAQAAANEFKEALISGKNFAVAEFTLQGGFKSVSDLIQFIQHPPMNKDIWDVIQAVETNFERRTGLSELMYGQSSRQMRSAQEAELKGDQLRIRPDDMATRVEEGMTALARKEALAARWFLTGQDVAPVMGQVGAQLWDQLIATSDVGAVMEYEYRIEANSVRRPNRDRDASNMDKAVQNLFQPLYAYATATMDVKPVNALIVDWARSIDLEPDRYLLQPMPPPMPAAPPAGPPPRR
jgi:hypothetical protein